MGGWGGASIAVIRIGGGEKLKKLCWVWIVARHSGGV